MKNAILGTIAVVVVATAIAAYSAEDQKSGSPMGGMMHRMKGMMGEQKPGEQSHDMMKAGGNDGPDVEDDRYVQSDDGQQVGSEKRGIEQIGSDPKWPSAGSYLGLQCR